MNTNLPTFPTLDHSKISEDLFERTVERLVNRADAALMANLVTQEQYDKWYDMLIEWAYCQSLNIRRIK